MPKQRKRRRRMMSALTIVRAARAAAKNALDSLRGEIRSTATRLEKLLTEERSFKADLFGAGAPGRGRRGRAGATAGKGMRPKARRKGPPQAEKFFKKLGNTFTLDDVRKVAGRKAGISLAQWSRAKRIRKTGKGYQKIAA